MVWYQIYISLVKFYTKDGQSIPIGGLAYYISPPRDLIDFIRDPLHSIFYVLFILISCG